MLPSVAGGGAFMENTLKSDRYFIPKALFEGVKELGKRQADTPWLQQANSAGQRNKSQRVVGQASLPEQRWCKRCLLCKCSHSTQGCHEKHSDLV